MLQFRPLVAVLMAVLLGLFFAPAAVAGREKTPDQTPNDHPSGKDRSDKPTEGKTQGKAKSDPDADANGGADKPGMDGGFDADQDGNNGCGNDDDFEDDNNGWCGGKPKVNTGGEDTELEVVPTKVLGTQTTRNVETGEQAAQVLGVSFARTTTVAAPAQVEALAATGASDNIVRMAAFALVLCSLGVMLVAVSSRREAQPIPVRVDGR